MIKKVNFIVSIMAVIALFMIAAPVAEAHVTVNPSESPTNGYIKYGVRVPVEKDINTTELTLFIPEDVNLISLQPDSEWDHDIELNDSEQITSVTWKANSGGVGLNEFKEFSFIAVNPDKATEVSWSAHQTYEDGSVVEWIDAPGSEEPASVTSVVESSEVASADSSDTDSSSSGTNSWLPITIASIALILAVIGLFRKPA